ncbi:MAG: polyphosphate kinase 1, partial [Cyclobacteriaceae bacterium]|nr:polyphosphate kinase 1 [Cyclobacteriaceae bacterium]
MTMLVQDRTQALIDESNYVSRDLSWLNFNNRVLDQAKNTDRTIFERLKFMAITASNLDEFFMIRVGSLYNYIDYGRQRVDYSGLRELPFREKLLEDSKEFFDQMNQYYTEELRPTFEENGFRICEVKELSEKLQDKVKSYFKKTIFPMLTPMAYDSYHTFPVLVNNVITFGVMTKSPGDMIAVGK